MSVSWLIFAPLLALIPPPAVAAGGGGAIAPSITVKTRGLPPTVRFHYETPSFTSFIGCNAAGAVVGIVEVKDDTLDPAARVRWRLWRMAPVPGPHPAERALVGFDRGAPPRLSRDGHWLAMARLPTTGTDGAEHSNGSVLIDLSTGREAFTAEVRRGIPPDAKVYFWAFSANGRFSIWGRDDISTPQAVDSVILDHRTGAITLIPPALDPGQWISNDGKLFIAQERENRKWGIFDARGRRHFPRRGDLDLARSSTPSEDDTGRRLAFRVRNPTSGEVITRIYELPGWRLVGEIPDGTPMALSADGSFLVVSRLGAPGVIEVASGKPLLPPDAFENQSLTRCGASGMTYAIARRVNSPFGDPLWITEITDLPAHIAGGCAVFRRSDFPRLTRDLRSENAVVAWRALYVLKAAGIRRAEAYEFVSVLPTAAETAMLRNLESLLGAPDFMVRERTERDLESMIRRLDLLVYRAHVQPALEAAARSGDPEVVRRASDLLNVPVSGAEPSVVWARLRVLAD